MSGNSSFQNTTTGPLELYLADLARPSRRTQAQGLEVVAAVLSDGRCDATAFPWWTLTHADAARARSYLVDRYSPSTARRVVAALRGVLKRCWRLGLMAGEDYQRAADLEPVRGTRLPPGRGVTRGELVALFDVCRADPTPRGRRDCALLALLYGCGLRRAEAAAVEVGDFDQDGTTLRVTGKGNRTRRVPVMLPAWRAVSAWVAERGDHPGRLFVSVDGRGRIRGEPVTGEAVYQVTTRRAAQAGIAHLSPHDCRRSFVSDLLERGADLSTVQRLCGHQGVDTTSRYDRRGERAMRTAVDLLFLPDTAPPSTLS